MNIEKFLTGGNVVDVNANYSPDIANVRKQLASGAELVFNKELISEWFDRGREILGRHGKEIYIHDLSKNILMPYCYSISVEPILAEGLTYYPHFKSKPPKRLDSFIAQLIEFTSYVANRTRGAIGIPDLILGLTYFVKKEGAISLNEYRLTDYRFRNELQRLFYSFNQHLRQGAESLYTNISFFDSYYLAHLFNKNSWGLDIDELSAVQSAVMRWHTREVETQMLRFPVITAALKVKNKKIQDEEFLEFAVKQNLHHTMYNFLVLPHLDAIASCCRLISSKKPFFNSYGSGGVQIGSHQVVSLNLPGIYLRYPDTFEERIKENLQLAKEFLDWHRKLLEEYQYLDATFELGLRSLRRMYSTIGIIGLWDLKQLIGLTYSWDDLENLLKEIRRVIDSWEGFYNCELVPAESAAISLYDTDKAYAEKHQKDKSKYYENGRMYSNQIVSPWVEMSLGERVEITGRFSKFFDGGQMMFVNVPSVFQNVHQMRKIIEAIVKKEVPYFAFDNYLSRCLKHNHLTLGDVDACPICGSKDILKFRRIVGYFVEQSNMHERRLRDLPYRKVDKTDWI